MGYVTFKRMTKLHLKYVSCVNNVHCYSIQFHIHVFMCTCAFVCIRTYVRICVRVCVCTCVCLLALALQKAGSGCDSAPVCVCT